MQCRLRQLKTLKRNTKDNAIIEKHKLEYFKLLLLEKSVLANCGGMQDGMQDSCAVQTNIKQKDLAELEEFFRRKLYFFDQMCDPFGALFRIRIYPNAEWDYKLKRLYIQYNTWGQQGTITTADVRFKHATESIALLERKKKKGHLSLEWTNWLNKAKNEISQLKNGCNMKNEYINAPTMKKRPHAEEGDSSLRKRIRQESTDEIWRPWN
eukprot:Lankesteria_metandrocarpae@DN1291_c0_g1_i1.p1